MRPQLFKTGGFTLIELMLVVAIIGLLAAIAIPKFANLVVKAKEASIRGKLGSLRSAITIYYADMEGFYPFSTGTIVSDLSPALVPKYISAIPSFGIPTVPAHIEGHSVYAEPVDADYDFLWDPAFGWCCTPGMPIPAYHYYTLMGQVRVNCTHTDSKGTTWSLW